MGELMPRSKAKLNILAALIPLILLTATPSGHARSIRLSVVKIYVTFQRADYDMPWQSTRPHSGTGTGFIIKGRRLLTNAHIVSNARFIEVQKDGSPTRYRARTDFIAHDCDLATLTVEDEEFFDGTQHVRFARTIPALQNEVTVFGYPMGGARLSITKGIVSRIDYTPYSHSSVDQHLALQVDAAINPGNSGGPIVYEGRVVGLAFQNLTWGENLGYGIPLPVIEHFLNDIADGEYHGYPELGVAFMDARNDALRTSLLIPPQKTGIVVYYIDPFGSAHGCLQEKDVLLAIDDHTIADDGTVHLNGEEDVLFSELLERKQWGDSVLLTVWRDGVELEQVIPLTNPRDPFTFRNLYDERPRYYVFAGLVFSPLNREYLKTLSGGRPSRTTHHLFYYTDYAKIDGHHEGRDEFVVLTRRLPHPVNTYSDSFVYAVLEEINGHAINRLADVPTALASPLNGYHVIRFAGMDETLVLDDSAAVAATPDILSAYGLTTQGYLGEEVSVP